MVLGDVISVFFGEKKCFKLDFGETLQLHILPWSHHSASHAGEGGFLINAGERRKFGDKGKGHVCTVPFCSLGADVALASLPSSPHPEEICLGIIPESFLRIEAWSSVLQIPTARFFPPQRGQFWLCCLCVSLTGHHQLQGVTELGPVVSTLIGTVVQPCLVCCHL